MTLRLRYFAETSIPVELEGLTPDWACDKTLAEVEKFEIFHGNRRVPLAEMFSVTGDPADRHWEFEGNLAGVHWIGAHMTSGRIDIFGPGGRHIGSEMRGGEIHVHGDAGGWTGAEMHGGFLHVEGNAGHLVGGAYRGSSKGMTDGTILVGGNAGNEIGLTMRRGLVAIGGNAGDLAGFNMIAGTVLVFGGCGLRPGAGMRRGTLGLLGPHPPPLLPSFRFVATQRPQILPVILRELRAKGLMLDESLLSAEFDFYQGDFVSLGRGEIVLRHP
jgi:formylmethanofuran dehydrogenase subunit C